ncbi:MAG: redoxin domain-containing protein [Planctomycetaceae bacterium]|nr:redoxin domain-containing protein [Planctomycetaceae bacterium]
MLRHASSHLLGLVLTLAIVTQTIAAQPTARQALSLVPMQKQVEFDRPNESEMKNCTISATKADGNRAWIVKDAKGNLLRRFVDTNSDNKIDQWCYYQGGIEVYRDIDANFNEKADQYRWFGTGGMRWGIDKNEDGRIDAWKWISPEEVSAELVRAMREQDANRFGTLLITKEEVSQLGLKTDFANQITARAKKAQDNFLTYAKGQKAVTDKTEWVDFSAPRPGVVPAGGDQAEKDLIVYENAIAVTDTSGQHEEVQVGTLVRIGDLWRLIDLPSSENSGFFFTVNERSASSGADSSDAANPQTQVLVEQLEDLDRALAKASSPPAIRKIYQRRSAVLEKLISASSETEKNMWLLQLVDSVVATAEPGSGDGGIQALKALNQRVNSLTEDQEILSQAKFALLMAEYTASLQKPNANFGKIQSDWIETLETFVTDYSGTRPAGEAMLQLAVSQEFAGEDTAATEWYDQIVSDYPNTEMSEKAAGAIRRLKSIGEPLELRGKGLDGRPIDLASLRGRVVLVHYWATWCEPCKEDMKRLRNLLAKNARRKFAIVGVNLDDQAQSAVDYVRAERIKWPQLHEEGGLESPLAKQLGVFTLPLMMLIDKDGTVVNRSITVEELEAEVSKRLSTRSRK